ncbi:NAD-dependent epimerase/dehydratase family protein [Streptomyces sp. NPDC048389]|uniref:NAD-dependent epimerase/dehydratase family protein n=1 Tax=Streptomyces sp. NPDC048389 TaxID=3154622 RepID=UPI003456B9EF
MRDICVIGGSRYVGKRLTARLLAAGDRVTVVNRGSSVPPEGALHLVADRNDEAALCDVLGDRTFDVVVDQVCYTPRQARTARRVFGGRTGRYVLTSSVEVYEYEDSEAPVREEAVDPGAVRVDLDAPWDDAGYLEHHYGEGNRQAEAVLAAAGPELPWVSVRTAHVLGGTDDFTGRVEHYASRMRDAKPVRVPVGNRPATYIHVEEIADFLYWTAGREFTGPVNANSHGPLVTADICEAIRRTAGGTTAFAAVEVGTYSPFSFARSYGMDNTRATKLGFSFSHTSEWLDRAVGETLNSRKGGT